MAIAYIKNGSPALWQGQPVNGVYHPVNIEQLWSDAQLNTAGLYRVQWFVTPAGKMLTGSPTYSLKGNVVVETYATVDIPAPPKPPAPPTGSGSNAVAS